MSDISPLEIEILQLVNAHRSKLELSPLSFCPPIQSASRQHSSQIALGKVPFGHQGFSERANALIETLKGTAASENVAMGQRSAEEVVNNWINSTGHRKNIEGDFNLTGIGVSKNKDGEAVFTQIFIKAPVPNDFLSDKATPATGQAEINLNYALLEQINQHRSEQYLPALNSNPHLQVAATQQAKALASGKISFGHEGFEERARTLLQKVGGSSVAENIAKGGKDSAQIVKSWLTSSGHRNNIEGDFNLTGIGIAKGEDAQVYYCQIFVKRSN